MTDLSSVFIKCPEFTKVRPFCPHSLDPDAELWIVDENREKLWKWPKFPVKYSSSKKNLVFRVWHVHTEPVTRVAGPVSLKANSSKVIFWKSNNMLHEF